MVYEKLSFKNMGEVIDFRRTYLLAEKYGQESFTWHSKQFHTKYASYLLDYINLRMNEADHQVLMDEEEE